VSLQTHLAVTESAEKAGTRIHLDDGNAQSPFSDFRLGMAEDFKLLVLARNALCWLIYLDDTRTRQATRAYRLGNRRHD
jgi:hypothetical protein